MTVAIVHENDVWAVFCGVMENCCMCRTPTRYWYGTGKDNVALCPACANKYDASDLPSKSDWIASERKINRR